MFLANGEPSFKADNAPQEFRQTLCQADFLFWLHVQNLAQVLGTTVEELCGEKQDKAGTLRDVLYNATEGLNDINMVSLISFAESLQRTQEEAFPDGINNDWDVDEEGIGFRKFGDRVKDLKKKYLGPEKDED